MKKIIAIAAVLMATTAFAEKIGVIDVTKVMTNYSETVKAHQSLETQAKKLENEAKQKEINLQKEQVALQSKGEKLTEKEKQAFEKRVQAYQGFLRDSQEKLMKEEKSKLEKINANLEKTINQIAKEGNYDYIVEKGAMLYGGEDISEKLLKALEKIK